MFWLLLLLKNSSGAKQNKTHTQPFYSAHNSVGQEFWKASTEQFSLGVLMRVESDAKRSHIHPHAQLSCIGRLTHMAGIWCPL